MGNEVGIEFIRVLLIGILFKKVLRVKTEFIRVLGVGIGVIKIFIVRIGNF